MKETDAATLLFMLMAVALGFMIGWACGEQVARRENAEAMVEELRERLEQASSETSQDRQLNEMRRVLNDAHKHILAVSKDLKNQPR
jgi:Tfp pilus assembly protein PilO